MSNESIIAHPQRERLSIVRESMKILCNGDECAARLLSHFEYMTNAKITNRTYDKLLQDALKYVNQRGYPVATGGWLPYDNNDLINGIVGGYKIEKIYEALTLLESLGFIQTDVPTDIVKYFHSGRKKWIWFRADNYNAALKEYKKRLGLQYEEGDDIGQFALLMVLSALGVRNQDIENIKKNVDKLKAFIPDAMDLFDYWKIIHNHKNSLGAPEKFEVIAAILEKGFSVGAAAQAIVGNLYSDFHQGRHVKNDKGTVFDRIQDIFADTSNSTGVSKVENMVRHAEQAGITEAKALVDFESVKKGLVSLYAKKTVIEAIETPEKAKQVVSVPKISGELKAYAEKVAPLMYYNDSWKEVFMEARNLLLSEKPQFAQSQLLYSLTEEIEAFGDISESKSVEISILVQKLCLYKDSNIQMF